MLPRSAGAAASSKATKARRRPVRVQEQRRGGWLVVFSSRRKNSQFHLALLGNVDHVAGDRGHHLEWRVAGNEGVHIGSLPGIVSREHGLVRGVLKLTDEVSDRRGDSQKLEDAEAARGNSYLP